MLANAKRIETEMEMAAWLDPDDWIGEPVEEWQILEEVDASFSGIELDWFARGGIYEEELVLPLPAWCSAPEPEPAESRIRRMYVGLARTLCVRVAFGD